MFWIAFNMVFVLMFSALAALYFYNHELPWVLMCVLVALVNAANLLDGIKKEVKK